MGGYKVGYDEAGHLIDLHLSEGIVDLGGGELDTEGHEGVPEMSIVMIMVLGFIILGGEIDYLKASASILPSISKASKEARMTSSSSEPPAILEANRVTIWVKFMGPSTSSSMAWKMTMRWIKKMRRT